MLFLTVTLTLALALCASAEKIQVFANLCEDLKEPKLRVLQVANESQAIPDDAISQGNLEILMRLNASESPPFKLDFGCVIKGELLSFSDSKEWISCCPSGQRPSGSPKTGFACCDVCGSLVGSHEDGFACCGQGQVWDGKSCKFPGSPCQAPEVPLGDGCVCSPGMARSEDGECQKTGDPKCLPSPSVQYGKSVTI